MELKQIYSRFLSCSSITMDSREVPLDSMFFALKGENFNGNKFAGEALGKGAKYAMVDEKKYAADERYIFVEDVLTTMQELATFHRRKLNLHVIGITGSNGKTTTKELISSVLKEKYHILSTEKNFNNHIGVPYTLLKLNSKHDIAVIEMGANHPGEIALLCNIADPDSGMITNIGKAHLEGFGSFNGVIKTKNELYDYLGNKNGIIFYNSDNQLLKDLLQDKQCPKIDYGTSSSANCQGHLINSTPYLTLKTNDIPAVHSRLIGSYNFENLLAAICIGKYFEVDPQQIHQAISQYQPDNNRSQVIRKANNEIILDAYNANPTSMKAAIEYFYQLKRNKKALILGDMFELGEYSDQEHRNIVALADEYNFSEVYYVGPIFQKNTTARSTFDSTKKFIAWLKNHPFKHYSILIKGSRGMALEEIIEHL
jgi:UDP-N-acetylmuramoyl-tripeptide--D-alanyl-D-alanine ligase